MTAGNLSFPFHFTAISNEPLGARHVQFCRLRIWEVPVVYRPSKLSLLLELPTDMFMHFYIVRATCPILILFGEMYQL
jgi:hypothetical protein